MTNVYEHDVGRPEHCGAALGHPRRPLEANLLLRQAFSGQGRLSGANAIKLFLSLKLRIIVRFSLAIFIEQGQLLYTFLRP